MYGDTNLTSNHLLSIAILTNSHKEMVLPSRNCLTHQNMLQDTDKEELFGQMLSCHGAASRELRALWFIRIGPAVAEILHFQLSDTVKEVVELNAQIH